MTRRPTMMPMMSGGGSGTGRRFLITLGVLVVLALVLRDPVGSAHTLQRLAEWASNFLDALSAFGSALSRPS